MKRAVRMHVAVAVVEADVGDNSRRCAALGVELLLRILRSPWYAVVAACRLLSSRGLAA